MILHSVQRQHHQLAWQPMLMETAGLKEWSASLPDSGRSSRASRIGVERRTNPMDRPRALSRSWLLRNQPHHFALGQRCWPSLRCTPRHSFPSRRHHNLTKSARHSNVTGRGPYCFRNQELRSLYLQRHAAFTRALKGTGTSRTEYETGFLSAVRILSICSVGNGE